MPKAFNYLAKAVLCAVFALVFSQLVFAQGTRGSKKAAKSRPPVRNSVKVTRIDIPELRGLLKPNGKPLLINFWATWCDPCREEFPDLVKLDAAYRGKIDFITISLDDLAEINTSVPKFLGEMKAEMPAYLLKTQDESAAITLVAKDWKGNLPLTILFSASGEEAYSRHGKVKYETVMAEIDKLLAPANPMQNPAR
ncbi:MAG TPA: TlpA disulfide reductase family protein [Pyrinomonadaceae bacterium]|nr:TlpA disulfide reductase family protein [Pyrinomonadaceae bacterium]